LGTGNNIPFSFGWVRCDVYCYCIDEIVECQYSDGFCVNFLIVILVCPDLLTAV
jgi:hypothetical protein